MTTGVEMSSKVAMFLPDEAWIAVLDTTQGRYGIWSNLSFEIDETKLEVLFWQHSMEVKRRLHLY